MKIFLAQQNYKIGDFPGNLEKIKNAIKQAREQQGDLVIFSELCICGYPPRDFLEFEDFIAQSEVVIAALLPLSKDLGIIVGAPYHNLVTDGKGLFNSAWFLYEEEVQHVAHKTCLPTYDIFDESRYFEPAIEWNVMEFHNKKLAITICEDIWSLDDDPLYPINPMDQLMSQQPDLIINISASPFDYNQKEKRLSILRANVRQYQLPLLYCNTVGAQTEMIFDGGSLVMDAEGKIQKALPYFEEALSSWELPDNSVQPATTAVQPATPPEEMMASILHQDTGNMPGFISGQLTDLPFAPERHIDRIYHALTMGIRDYFSKLQFSQAILGSSGGIDSAVALALASAALGKDNVHAVMMPSAFSSDHSVADAVTLAENLGHPYDILPIEGVYDAFVQALHPLFQNLPFDLAEENIQARARGNLLMALANKFGYILLNTSNKSELAVGYGTLYGDMAGGLSVLGDLYKTQVYALAHYINRDRIVIPENILRKAPSAELRPDQKDSDSLPDYNQLDRVLYAYIEHGKGPRAIEETTHADRAMVQRILRLVNTNEYKRNQFCPILRVSCKAFGAGRRVPIVGKYLS